MLITLTSPKKIKNTTWVSACTREQYHGKTLKWLHHCCDSIALPLWLAIPVFKNPRVLGLRLCHLFILITPSFIHLLFLLSSHRKIHRGLVFSSISCCMRIRHCFFQIEAVKTHTMCWPVSINKSLLHCSNIYCFIIFYRINISYWYLNILSTDPPHMCVNAQLHIEGWVT